MPFASSRRRFPGSLDVWLVGSRRAAEHERVSAEHGSTFENRGDPPPRKEINRELDAIYEGLPYDITMKTIRIVKRQKI
jgi:hypothetical protein